MTSVTNIINRQMKLPFGHGKNYACTYMRTWDRQLFTNTDMIPTLYVRFVDDIFGTWDHGIDAPLQFHDKANRIHPNIKVELRWNRQKIAFLDTMVRLENEEIETKKVREKSRE